MTHEGEKHEETSDLLVNNIDGVESTHMTTLNTGNRPTHHSPT